ncbi:MAG: OmpH family outer membrane protein [Leptolyngbya sp.]|nr:OmpH family outer membrane protein [Candidatus Melainabacteria bacterium]
MTIRSRKSSRNLRFPNLLAASIFSLSFLQTIAPSFAVDESSKLAPQTPPSTPTETSVAPAAVGVAKAAIKTSPLLGKSAWFSRGKVLAYSASQQKREMLKAQAESQLRQSAQEAINVLQKMQKDGRPTADITAEEARRKTQVESQQKALAELVGKSMSEGRSELVEAVAAVAREKGLTLVLDLDGIFYGGEDLKDTSRDVTDAVISKMR